MKHLKHRTFGLKISLYFLVAVTFFCSIPSTALAEVSVGNNPTKQASRYMYYLALHDCIKEAANSVIGVGDVRAGKIFTGKETEVGNYFNYLEGKDSDFGTDTYTDKKCTNTGFVLKAFEYLGVTPLETFCAIGYKDKNGTCDVSMPGDSTLISSDADNSYADKFDGFIKTKLGDLHSQFANSAANYVRNRYVLYSGCFYTVSPSSFAKDDKSTFPQGDIDNRLVYGLKEVDTLTGGITTKYYDVARISASAKSLDDKVKLSPNVNNNYDGASEVECGALADSINNGLADTYRKYVKLYPGDESTVEAPQSDQACATDPSLAGCEDTNTTTCAVEGVGWIVCPAMKFMGGITDAAFKLVTEMLSFNPNLIEVSDTNGTYVAWKFFRDLANVVFVIAFLVIIFSQLTSVGITNYGVKKLLPRLVITAVLVNVSFFLCQIAVDVSEILGHSLNSFLSETIPNQMVIKEYEFSLLENISHGLSYGFAIQGAAVATGAAAVLGYLSFSTPVVLAAILSVLMTLLILVLRRAIIIILVAISPLAFVCFLLPNTEQWFKKWSKMLLGLLMVYPIISILYGGGQLAGLVIHNADPGNPLTGLVAFAASVLPMALTPFILKSSMNATGTLGAKLSGWSSKANSGLTSRIKDSSKLGTGVSSMLNYNKQKRLVNYAKRRSSGKGIEGLGNNAISAFGSKGYADHLRTQGASLEDKELEENIAAAAVSYKAMEQNEVTEIATGKVKASEAERIAAVRHVMANGSFANKEKIIASSSVPDTTGKTRAAIHQGYFASGANKIYGSSFGDSVLRGKTDDGNDINLGSQLEKRIANGDVTAEALTYDDGATKKIVETATRLGQLDKLVEPAKTALTTAGTAEKVNKNIRDEFSKIPGVPADTAPTAPQPNETMTPGDNYEI